MVGRCQKHDSGWGLNYNTAPNLYIYIYTYLQIGRYSTRKHNFDNLPVIVSDFHANLPGLPKAGTVAQSYPHCSHSHSLILSENCLQII